MYYYDFSITNIQSKMGIIIYYLLLLSYYIKSTKTSIGSANLPSPAYVVRPLGHGSVIHTDP
jgi:hypothetical protein